ncbi:MAG: hypothetical protein AAB281_02250, partial [Actinomycetota bacterium]
MKENVLGRIAALLLMVIVAALTVAVATGCGAKEKPSDTVEKFYILLSERKFNEAYGLLAYEGKTKILMDEEYFVSNAEKQTPQGRTLTAFSVISETEDGDNARVRFSATFQEPDKEPQTNEVETRLVKVDGKWKIIY